MFSVFTFDLVGENIKYNGDPLDDFTLIRFLDRFAFKNPKTGKDKQSVFARRYEVKGVKAIGVGSNVS